MGRYRFIIDIFSKKQRRITKLLKLMKHEKDRCLEFLIVKDWEGVHFWLEKSKKTIKAVQEHYEIMIYL